MYKVIYLPTNEYIECHYKLTSSKRYNIFTIGSCKHEFRRGYTARFYLKIFAWFAVWKCLNKKYDKNAWWYKRNKNGFVYRRKQFKIVKG